MVFPPNNMWYLFEDFYVFELLAEFILHLWVRFCLMFSEVLVYWIHRLSWFAQAAIRTLRRSALFFVALPVLDGVLQGGKLSPAGRCPFLSWTDTTAWWSLLTILIAVMRVSVTRLLVCAGVLFLDLLMIILHRVLSKWVMILYSCHRRPPR